MRWIFLALLAISTPALAAPGNPTAPPVPAELLAEARALLVSGACAEGTPDRAAAAVRKHCVAVRAAQDAYRTRWLALAQPFFAEHVPATLPTSVVYPFAGGDLSTALTVFPRAAEITTLSLEPAGDPFALARLPERQLGDALGVVATELTSLYRHNFSVTMNMIGAMRGGALPTQLIFSLSALVIHGYELTAMRYFRLADDGAIAYLTAADIEALATETNAGKRNRGFGNVELRFRKGGGREQVYRHIMANLDDEHLAKSPAALRHLEAKGQVAAMTKAASYLLTFRNFATMRTWITERVAWMVSDSTGLPPKVGEPAGFRYEVFGSYAKSNMKEGASVTPQWVALYAAQPARPLGFRFGYPDGRFRGHGGHLIIMRKGS